MQELLRCWAVFDDPGIEIEIAVRKFGLPHIFSREALLEADKLPDQVAPDDYEDRVDLRDIPLVTIDGEDARDFDDAVYCEPVKLADGDGYRLIVAIADVSHYVRPNTPLDKDALLRATSVYFPRRGHSHVAGKTVERTLFAEPRRGQAGSGV